MARAKKTRSELIPGAPAARRERVLVALALAANRRIREEALARGWRLVHLWYGDLPADVVPRGALVDELPDSGRVKKLRKLGVPVVRLGNLPHPEDGAVPPVLPDHVAEGRLAAEHFFERGFRDVAYFGRDPWSDAQAIFEGFSERAEALGISCHLYRFKNKRAESTDARAERRQREFIEWLRRVPKPLGVLASGDWRAAVNCAWAIEAGFNLPSDVAVLSRGNDLDICESAMPTISSLDQDNEGRIHAACELLDRIMTGEPAPTEPVMIPPRGVVERESTNVLATPDRAVAAALRYMWDHLDLDLSVEDIAGEVGMSSRQLSRRFRQSLNRSVTEELQRKRLEEAKHLLRSTDLAIADLAPMVGFRSTTYLHRTFREAFGMTPAQYRRGG